MVGKNVQDALSERDAETIAPSREELDLMNKGGVRELLRNCEPDVVVHCAGLVGGIRANIESPYDFALQNMTIGSNVVDACLETGTSRLINLGSSCMYPRDSSNPLKEEMILTGSLEPTNEGYGIAKVAVSRLCKYANAQYGTNFKTLIPCNLFGYYDNFDLKTAHLIPGVMHRLHKSALNSSSSVDIWGDGSARREFMFAGDFADFICSAVELYDDLPEEMNVGMGTDHSVKEYYELIAEVVGYEGSFKHDLSKPQGMSQKLVDISFQGDLGWSPPTTIGEAIAVTYQHFLETWI
jgi:GDP-L-fucose synthase